MALSFANAKPGDDQLEPLDSPGHLSGAASPRLRGGASAAAGGPAPRPAVNDPPRREQTAPHPASQRPSRGQEAPRGKPDHPGRYSTLGGVMPDLVLITLFMNILALALPLVLLQVYDRILPNEALGTLGMLVAGVLSALVLETLLRLGRSYITGWVGARFEHLAGVAALRRLLGASIQDFETAGSGLHLERLGALAQVKDFYAGQALLSLLDLPFAAVYLTVIWLLGGPLVLVPLGLLAAFAVTALWLGHTLRQAIALRMTSDDRRINFIIEVLNGSHTLKSMAMEAQMLRRYERLQDGCAQANHTVTLRSTAALGAGAFFSQATLVATVGVGGWLVVAGDLTVGGLAACTLLAGRSLQPIQRALGIWTRFQTIRLARARLQEIFALPQEHGGAARPPATVTGRLTLEGVGFRYGGDRGQGPLLLHDLSLDIAPGECLGIAGGNGSGKSTLLSLMSGALPPTTGRVLLDGVPLDIYDPRLLKRHIAHLPQQGALFRGTMLENLTMFDPGRNEAAIRQAEDLGLGSVVAGMPLGYDTPVGDTAGETLPRGIRQRIAVARALLPEPQVVLFDEANTAVDGTGDAHLKACLERLKGERTLVLVTHRPSLLKLADRVFDLADGTLTPRRPAEPTTPAADAPGPDAGADRAGAAPAADPRPPADPLPGTGPDLIATGAQPAADPVIEPPPAATAGPADPPAAPSPVSAQPPVPQAATAAPADPPAAPSPVTAPAPPRPAPAQSPLVPAPVQPPEPSEPLGVRGRPVGPPRPVSPPPVAPISDRLSGVMDPPAPGPTNVPAAALAPPPGVAASDRLEITRHGPHPPGRPGRGPQARRKGGR